MTLAFPNDEDSYDLFSSSKCERTLRDGTKRMAGAAMDGSAVGILGKLPNFKQIIHQINIVLCIGNPQYVMRTSKSRRSIECILVSAPNCDNFGCFVVPLMKGLW